MVAEWSCPPWCHILWYFLHAVPDVAQLIPTPYGVGGFASGGAHSPILRWASVLVLGGRHSRYQTSQADLYPRKYFRGSGNGCGDANSHHQGPGYVASSCDQSESTRLRRRVDTLDWYRGEFDRRGVHQAVRGTWLSGRVSGLRVDPLFRLPVSPAPPGTPPPTIFVRSASKAGRSVAGTGGAGDVVGVTKSQNWKGTSPLHSSMAVDAEFGADL